MSRLDFVQMGRGKIESPIEDMLASGSFFSVLKATVASGEA